jgi:hypothetical protein
MSRVVEEQIEAIGVGLRERERLRRLRRAQRDLWWLATEVLGFGLLTEGFHRPMMREMDLERLAYERAIAEGGVPVDVLDLWPRDFYKTTVRVCQCIQTFLIDPAATCTWWHAVEEKAQEAGLWIGRQFQENALLRELRMEMMPTKADRRWNSAAGFRFLANNDKAPSLRSLGAGSESTGGHSRYGFLDDPIGANDVEDNQLPRKRRWYEHTVTNVVKTGRGWKLGTGTRWDQHDLYADWIRSGRWKVRVRACYERDGKPDWEGDPVLYSRDQIEAKRSEMSAYHFSCQMMNDPLPEEQRIWSGQCEQDLIVDVRVAMEGQGRVFVLSDPAPSGIGSLRGEGERRRRDGSKDEWAIAAVRLRVVGSVQQGILLDLVSSRDWSMSEGLDQALRLCTRWGTDLFFNEAYGGLIAQFTDEARRASHRTGVPLFLAGGQLPSFRNSYAAGSKNLRFEVLTDWARTGRFKVASSVAESMVARLLDQLRGWRVHGTRVALAHDDLADVVARMTDPALQSFAPRFGRMQPSDPSWRRAFPPAEESFGWGTRHIRA